MTRSGAGEEIEMAGTDPFAVRSPLPGLEGVDLFRIDRLAGALGDPSRLPVTVKILLENVLRHAGERFVSEGDVEALAGWDGGPPSVQRERPYMPARVLLQDFTGVPTVVDLAAMRAAMARAGGDPQRIDPLVPVDLVIDHSVQVDAFGSAAAYGRNLEREYERNHERYSLLRWAQSAFRGFRVVPPGMGIVHQVNLEYLADVVQVRDGVALPDTLVGTDSHTTMVNGIGVLGWGVGGIEAEAVMLGQPLFLLSPIVVGVRFVNSPPAGTTATDLVLTLTEMLRAHGVVGKFIEFCGDGSSALSAADRATLSNMAPEYGATAALFPVDGNTLRYLRESGRPPDRVELIERYTKEQGMFRRDGDATPVFSELLELDLATVVPSLAGPRRPQDRVPLDRVAESFDSVYPRGGAARVPSRDEPAAWGSGSSSGTAAVAAPASGLALRDGAVVIAAITSCTNTSNPSVMLGAGLLARNAVERGLQVPGYVKTSLAPGSRVVTDYLERAGLMTPLEALGFNLVGYGCTTCIGNSGPLDDDVAREVERGDLAVVAVLSGNRNFEGRIHAQVKAAYLASPPLVVAYALAGTVLTDLTRDPIGRDPEGRDVFLSELWPSSDEVQQAVATALGVELFHKEYAHIFDGDEHWQQLPSPKGELFEWDPASTYVREPSYFAEMARVPAPLQDISNARVLVRLGDSITTDHISPAGNISPTSPAAAYLGEHGVQPREFNTYGARRGNHEVMVRGTFANIRLRNVLADGVEGGVTKHLPDGELMTVYDAAVRYAREGIPLIVLAGKEYGSGSSRDWAAKGTALQGVRAVIAESYERIHRSNLVGLGILPLQYRSGETAESLGLTGLETYTITGLAEAGPGTTVSVVAHADDGVRKQFDTVSRLDSVTDVDYFHHGGVLLYVLRELMAD